MYSYNDSEKWQKSCPDVFWGEIAPCEHVVQIYEDDNSFVDLLQGFVSSGFIAQDSVIVIATPGHLAALDQRLKSNGHDVFTLTLRDQYIPLDANEVLNQFMINAWPDENLFLHVVSTLLGRAKNKGKRVRAFGEMVALLWSQGHNGATVQLENLWTEFCNSQSFSLFCAYPRTGFTQKAADSVMHICNAHSKIISTEKHSNELYYKNLG